MEISNSATPGSSPNGKRTQQGASPSSGKGLPGTPTVASSVPGAVYDDDGPLGGMARTFLRSSPARRLVVEVDYVQGRAPSTNALNHLQQVLSGVCAKPGGVVVQRGSAIASSGSSYSIEDIKAIERWARSARSAGDTATIWIVYLDGELSDAPGALGVAFDASSAAIFRDRIDEATTAVFLATEIERAVIVHEAGHLLALVNIGYKSRIAHEDAQHPHHSSNDESVMFWAVEDVSIKNLLGGGPPDDFDDADRADLAMLRNGG